MSLFNGTGQPRVLGNKGGPLGLGLTHTGPVREALGFSLSRDAVIEKIRLALKQRSGKTWSVSGGRGTAYGWINIDAPPKRRTWHSRDVGRVDGAGNPVYQWYEDKSSPGYMSPAERAELAGLLGLTSVHHQGVSIPSGHDYYREYIARAEGRTPEVHGKPYWD